MVVQFGSVTLCVPFCTWYEVHCVTCDAFSNVCMHLFAQVPPLGAVHDGGGGDTLYSLAWFPSTKLLLSVSALSAIIQPNESASACDVTLLGLINTASVYPESVLILTVTSSQGFDTGNVKYAYVAVANSIAGAFAEIVLPL